MTNPATDFPAATPSFAAKAAFAGIFAALAMSLCNPAYADSGTFIRNNGSGFVLDVVGAQTNSGQPVILFTRNNNANQIFDLQHVDGRYFKIVARHSGKCLDVTRASHDNGARVIQWDCHGGDNQLWEMHWVPDAQPCAECFVSGGPQLVAKHSGKCLDAGNPNFPTPPRSDAVLQQWSCARTTAEPHLVNQAFSFDTVDSPVVR